MNPQPDIKFGALSLLALMVAVALLCRSCTRYNLGRFTLHLDAAALSCFGFGIYFMFRAIGWIQ